MARLRSHRRDRRARAGKQRRRRNLTKFVPSSDSDFAMTAKNFADHVWKHREEFSVAERDAEYLCRLVKRYRDALAVTTRPSMRTTTTIRAKTNARKLAEHQVRMIGAKIRNDPAVEHRHKRSLRLVELPPRRKTTRCPRRPPQLVFIGVGDGTDGRLGAGNGSGVHVIKFYDYQGQFGAADFATYRKARPDGASRIELWVGHIPQGMRVPKSIQEYVNCYGWPLFLDSFPTSPMEARFPMPSQPMLIVYWARWANEKGEHGAFCKTLVGRVEGWAKGLPAAPSELPAASQESQVKVHSGARYALPGAAGLGNVPMAQLIEAQRMQATFLLVGTPFGPSLRQGDDESQRLLDAA